MKFFSQDIQATHTGTEVDTSPWSDFWFSNASAPTRSGFNVTPDNSEALSAVFAAVRLLSQTTGMLPFFMFERKEDGTKARAPDHPLDEILHDRPNNWQTAMEFREMMTAHCLLRGNAYAQIMPGERGAVDQLIPLNPDRMKVVRLPNNRLRYDFRPKGGGKPIPFTQDEMMHLRGHSRDGVTGISVIGLARETIGLSFATENHGATFFGNRAAPAVALKHPSNFKSKEVQERVADSWNKAYGGPRHSNKTAVLEEGMDIEILGVANEDSQFLETREFQITEIARWFHVPPHMIADLKRATFSNIEEQSLEFVVYSLMPWLKRWEGTVKRDLIFVDRNRFFAEHRVDALLRGNIKTRNEAHRSAIVSGWKSRNEVRDDENMNRVDGLDEYLVPTQTMTIDEEEKANSQTQQITRAAADRVLRKEATSLAAIRRKATNVDDFQKRVVTFYIAHEKFVAEVLGIGSARAGDYCASRARDVVQLGLEGVESLGEPEANSLARFALGS